MGGQTDSPRLHFVPITHGQKQDAESRRLARAHATRVASKRHRELSKKEMAHFRVTTVQHMVKRHGGQVQPASDPGARRETASLVPVIKGAAWYVFGPQVPPRASRIDPFDALPECSPEIEALLRSPSFRKAAEPLFSVDDNKSYHDLASVFPWCFTDTAFFHALVFTTLVVQNDGLLDRKCLSHKGKALQLLNQSISNPRFALSERCIGTIMVLTGAEYRLGNKSAHEAHMAGLSKIVSLCDSKSNNISAGLRRALFWQDLMGATMSGSNRVFTHDAFEEVRWNRDDTVVRDGCLPPGFLSTERMLPLELLDVLTDLEALRASVSKPSPEHPTVYEIHRIQASIESRLFFLREETLMWGAPAESARIATFICSYCVFTDVWDANMVPQKLSKDLANILSTSYKGNEWTGHEELLVWCIFVGTVFAEQTTRGIVFVSMMKDVLNNLEYPIEDWRELETYLRQFIWFEKRFSEQCRVLWLELRPDSKDEMDPAGVSSEAST